MVEKVDEVGELTCPDIVRDTRGPGMRARRDARLVLAGGLWLALESVRAVNGVTLVVIGESVSAGSVDFLCNAESALSL